MTQWNHPGEEFPRESLVRLHGTSSLEAGRTHRQLEGQSTHGTDWQGVRGELSRRELVYIGLLEWGVQDRGEHEDMLTHGGGNLRLRSSHKVVCTCLARIVEALRTSCTMSSASHHSEFRA